MAEKAASYSGAKLPASRLVYLLSQTSPLAASLTLLNVCGLEIFCQGFDLQFKHVTCNKLFPVKN